MICRRSRSPSPIRCGFDRLERVLSQTAMMLEWKLWLSSVVLGRRGGTWEDIQVLSPGIQLHGSSSWLTEGN